MRIDDYILRHGKTEDLQALNLSEEFIYIVGKMPKEIREELCFFDSDFFNLQINSNDKIAGSRKTYRFSPARFRLSDLSLKQKLKLWVKLTLISPLQLAKDKKAVVYCGVFDEFLLTKDPKLVAWMCFEPVLISFVYAAELPLSFLRKAKRK